MQNTMQFGEGFRFFAFDFAWECGSSQKKVAISFGSGEHDMHHSQVKC